MTDEEIKKKIDLHQKYFKGEPDGECAEFNYEELLYKNFSAFTKNLTGAEFLLTNLYNANFSNIDLELADFTGANLRCACFYGADLRGADFRGANLQKAFFRKSKLKGANFYEANLFGADLRNVDLDGVAVHTNTIGYFLACPSEGAFTAFKKVQKYIVVLEVPADAKRSSATTYKCRCDKAKVLRIENLDGSPAGVDSVASGFDKDFLYTIGETVKVDDFDEDRWNECSRGIHFFIDRAMAVLY